MENNIIKEFNYSKQGKNSIRKYLYLLDRENHIGNLEKILSKKKGKKFLEDDYYNDLNMKLQNSNIDNDNIIFEDDIFKDDYMNKHNQIIEEQKAKYIYSREKYKYHISHLNSKNNKIENDDTPKLILFNDGDQSEKAINILLKRIEFSQSFDKVKGRNKNIDKNDENKNINMNKNEVQNEKLRKNENNFSQKLEKNNIGGSYVELKNQTTRGDIPKHYDVRIRIEKKFLTKKNEEALIKNKKPVLSPLKGKNNLSYEKSLKDIKLPSIIDNKDNMPNKNKNKVDKILKNKLKNILMKKNKKFLNKKSSLSLSDINKKPIKNISKILNDSKNIQKGNMKKNIKGISFNNMLSRVNKNSKTNEIKGIFCPLTPNYSSIYPKLVRNICYGKKTSSKDHSRKLEGIKGELIFDINKVFNKYNNHKEPKSFSIDKMIGREDKYLNKLELEETNNSIEEKEKSNKFIKDLLNEIKSYFNINIKVKNSRKNNNNKKEDKDNIIYNNKLENTYKQLIKKNISENDIKIKRILNGNKINLNYKKLLNYYNKIKNIENKT